MDISEIESANTISSIVVDNDFQHIVNSTFTTLSAAVVHDLNYSGNQSLLDAQTSTQVCRTYDFAIEAVCMGILCLFGFCGNTLSMICLSRDKSKTATPFLLVSLEAGDTFFLFTVLILRVFNTISTYFEIKDLDLVWAYAGKYVYPFALIAETGTVYLTLLVTVNRYVSVCKPYDASSLCSVPNARIHVLVIIVFSMVYNIPRFLEYTIGQITYPEVPINETWWIASQSDMARNSYYQIIYVNSLYFIIMFLIPLVILIFLNSNLIIALRETQRRRAQLLSSSDTHNRSEDDITLILILVVLVFIVCHAPALVTQLLGYVLDEDSFGCGTVYFFYERISDLLIVANSSLNFIIYCFCSTKFRQILKSLVCKNNVDSPEQSRRTEHTVVREDKHKRKEYTQLPLSAPTENGTGHTVLNNEHDDSKV